MIHVSAGNPFRRWPEAAFAALVSALALNDERRRIIVRSLRIGLPPIESAAPRGASWGQGEATRCSNSATSISWSCAR